VDAIAVFVIDPRAAIALARREYTPVEDREMFAPTLLRSQVLAICRREVAAGSMEATGALDLGERACRLPRRLLGDAVLRRTAWKLADEHGWPDTYDAEYIALTQLHGVALVAGSDALRELAAPIVTTQTVESFAGNP
jgi:predicted nucleic acid-binding protein